MFFMWLFYTAVFVGGCYAIWKWVIFPIIEEGEKEKQERQARIDEQAAKRIAKEALLAGDDIQHDLDARVSLLEELSAKMQKLTQTAQVADRIADVQSKISQLKGEIAEADAKAHAATSEGPIIVDEEGVAKVPDEEGFAETPGDNAPKPKPDSNPADPEPKITKGGRKVAHAKPKD